MSLQEPEGGGDTSALGAAAGAGKGFLVGVGTGAVEMAKGLWSLAKGAVQLTYDQEARDRAWETTKRVGSAVKDYGGASIDDPAKPVRDAKAGALAAYSSVEKARDEARAAGQEPEFWGQAAGRAAFEIGALLVPLGAATKAGRLSKAAEEAGELANVAAKAEEGANALSKAEKITAAQNAPREAAAVLKEECIVDKVSRELDRMYEAAPAAKSEIDTLAKEIADKHGGKVAQAPLKGKERAMEKAIEDYGGDASRVSDLARNTIIVPKEKMADVVAELEARGIKVNVVDPETNPFGYGGANSKVNTAAGIKGEIQVNTPEMIFAKESPANARAQLGDELYEKIANETGGPGGKGHELYEQARSLPPDSPERAQLEQQSREYYQRFR
jgi:hypothetical protein